ncbi:hypothetical protein CEXT_328661 [Caerostris extrusa]|uniref:Uncharacterized protein n=1 Tax=Caerostris extrusa TaxID=172846 RepID=A0AAV4V8Y3_CAEEX|nr:hypothetical protein CEXT_328661 [Caerostris extrusa]
MKDPGKTTSKLSIIPVHFPSRDTNETEANDNCQPIKTLEISHPLVQWAGCLHKEVITFALITDTRCLIYVGLRGGWFGGILIAFGAFVKTPFSVLFRGDGMFRRTSPPPLSPFVYISVLIKFLW